MSKHKLFVAFLCFWTCLLAVVAQTQAAAAAPAFEISLDPQLAKQPLTGRLFLFLQNFDEAKPPAAEPRMGFNWFTPEPFFALDVKDLSPNRPCRIDDTADAYPEPLSRIKPGHYRAQAILDQNPDVQNPGNGVGNLYSEAVTVDLDPALPRTFKLVLNQVTQPQPWPDSRWAQEVIFPSKLLSQFHHREVQHVCAVALPSSYYDQPNKRYPLVFIIPGFGGDHRRALQYADQPPEPLPGEEECIRVFLSGQCNWGDHEYADSAVNGPRGESFVSELIPELDRRYRTIPDRNARFLYGHSSGGWAALWLMINYPQIFGGVWSDSPDPVDFRDFQGIDIYANPPQSMYVDPTGHKRPLARKGDQVTLWFDDFGRMDDVFKRGGQLRSFEAVFSPLGPEGQPQQLWDRRDGRINPQVAHDWQKYDLRLLIEKNWQQLQPLLAGRVHITVGDQDTFYLDGAVRLLAESLKQLGSDAEVTFLPGRGHSDYLNADYYLAIRKQMSDLFRSNHPGP